MEGGPPQGGFLEGVSLSRAGLEKAGLQLCCIQVLSPALSLPLPAVSSGEALGEGWLW